MAVPTATPTVTAAVAMAEEATEEVMVVEEAVLVPVLVVTGCPISVPLSEDRILVSCGIMILPQLSVGRC